MIDSNLGEKLFLIDTNLVHYEVKNSAGNDKLIELNREPKRENV